MGNVSVSPIKEADIPAVVTLLGRAYANNPLHVAVFGKNNVDANIRFMSMAFKEITGKVFVATAENKVAGVIRIIRHPLPATPENTSPPFSPDSLQITESALARIQEWTGIWNNFDPKEPHYHFGPVAVLPELQHQGIGSRLMAHCCRILDRESETGYLETETTLNVKFYSRFGFKVVREIEVIGQPNWFMQRSPQPSK